MKAATTGALGAMVLAAIGAVTLVLWRGAAVEAAYPVERGKSLFVRKIVSRVKGALGGAEAAAENVNLKRRVSLMTLRLAEAESLEAENERLRRVLGYSKSARPGFIAAEVLSRGGGAAGSGETLRADKGSLAGVVKDAVVTVPEGLVGKVVSVTPHTCEIRLVTDRRLYVACEVETKNPVKTRGIISGGGHDILLMRHLTHAGEIPVRSRVLTSGLGGVFPKGIEIGTLLIVTNQMREVTGKVSPAVDFSALEDVFIRSEK